MARKPTDKQLFKMKNEWLGQFYEQVKPKEFYRAVFPEGSFDFSALLSGCFPGFSRIPACSGGFSCGATIPCFIL